MLGVHKIKDIVSLEKNYKRGDTIIEVIFAITVFAMVSILTITMMNQGLATGTASLQLTLARQEMDAQAEAIRFIHDSYAVERNMPAGAPPIGNQLYTGLWRTISDSAIVDERTINVVPPFVTDGTDCEAVSMRGGLAQDLWDRRFVVNTRLINPQNASNYAQTIITPQNLGTANGRGFFTPPPLFPRLVYGSSTGVAEDGTETNEIQRDSDVNRVVRVEGIWVFAVRRNNSQTIDFHIRACWYSPGRAVVSTLGTIVRVQDADTEL